MKELTMQNGDVRDAADRCPRDDHDWVQYFPLDRTKPSLWRCNRCGARADEDPT